MERHDVLEPYVTGVIRRFRSDPGALAWDLFNEPDNPNVLSYLEEELLASEKDVAALQLLRKAFAWARSADPLHRIHGTVGWKHLRGHPRGFTQLLPSSPRRS